jgi:succinate dehydrogenase / fumarate reductase cytochrome b subunit
VKKARPVNLDLMTIRMPINAVVSILHRISGVFVFLFIPMFLWMLRLSTFSELGFLRMQECLASPISKMVIWVTLSGLIYHLVAGIRHLIMDMGIGEERESGRLAAQISLGVSIILIVSLGVWLW